MDDGFFTKNEGYEAHEEDDWLFVIFVTFGCS